MSRTSLPSQRDKGFASDLLAVVAQWSMMCSGNKDWYLAQIVPVTDATAVRAIGVKLKRVSENQRPVWSPGLPDR
jgi:hypothetical protein